MKSKTVKILEALRASQHTNFANKISAYRYDQCLKGCSSKSMQNSNLCYRSIYNLHNNILYDPALCASIYIHVRPLQSSEVTASKKHHVGDSTAITLQSWTQCVQCNWPEIARKLCCRQE